MHITILFCSFKRNYIKISVHSTIVIMAEQEGILRKIIDVIAKDQKYLNFNVTVKPISTDGANYTSKLFLITVSEADKENLELFVKFNTFSEKICSELHYYGYETERFMYTELAKTYKAIEEENKIPLENKLFIPQHYNCDLNIARETLVLENLQSKGYTTRDRFESIDWEYASKSVETLAKFHALSIPHRGNRSSTFNNLLNNKGPAFYFISNIKESYPVIIENAINATNDKNKEKVKNYINNIAIFEKYQSFYTNHLRRQFIIHGDFRVSNLMHKVNEDGSLVVIPVDYQTIHMSSPVLDLLFFIFTGSDEAFRRQYYDQLIEHYYKELRRALSQLHVDPDKVYSKKDFESDLKEFSTFGLFTSMCVLPLITVEAEDAPEMGEEVSDIHSFVRLNCTPRYRERWNGIVNDYIRWGIL
ncbi:uncharacterized protein LOC113515788 [Galleria mellonella]|uniref:Uncharacterized protein LOC113515788 n=1 Tax=Galleria mellonella TaxID=7137 RepID=A0A6J1WLX1_GALME|nr:uncharacterized protein LOC113515788 [Galleria mellonella]